MSKKSKARKYIRRRLEKGKPLSAKQIANCLATGERDMHKQPALGKRAVRRANMATTKLSFRLAMSKKSGEFRRP